jgi:hypothetical protein
VGPPQRASLEKSVSRALVPRVAAGKANSTGAAASRPAGARMARGTQGLERIAEPVRRPAHLRSSTDCAEIVTATDVTAVDRARASMREEEETRVNLVAAPSATAASSIARSSAPSTPVTIDIALDDDEQTTVEPVDVTSPSITIASVGSGDASPLPRLTARLRRSSPPN